MYVDSSGVIHWLPVINQIDNHDVNINVSDEITSETITLSLFVNAPPVVSKRPAKHINLEKTDIWEYQLISFDANNSSEISWKLLDAPYTMTLDSSGNLRWMVNEVDYWNYTIQVLDGIDSTQFTNTIYSNYIPQITSSPITSIIWVNEYNYQLIIRDDNKFSAFEKDIPNELKYSFTQSPSNMSVSDSGLVLWQPTINDEGIHEIILNVSDGLSTTKQKYNLLVEGPPTITTLDSLSIPIGDSLNFVITHKNFKDSTSLSFNIEGLPKSITIDSTTGKGFWKPDLKDVGLFELNISIQNNLESANKISKLFIYQYPEVNLEAPTEAYVGLTYTYELEGVDMFGKYVDENGGEVVISSDTISNILFDNETHTIQWAPSEDDLGDHEFTVEVRDQFGLTVTITHYVSVFMSPCELCKSANRKPKKVKQILTPVFKKDTPEEIEKKLSTNSKLKKESAILNPSTVTDTLNVDSLKSVNTILDSSLIKMPIDTLNVPIIPDSTIIDSIKK